MIVVSAVLALLIFVSVSLSFKDTQTIWYMTRIFGLIAFLSLFLTLLLGELRMIHLEKSNFELFKFHKPLAIVSLTLVFTHFLTAVIDDYKWGKSIAFVQYLGFSFSDKWLVALSLGTLAFYIMIIVAFTSAKKSVQFLTFKKWKIIHYLSYASFTIAYIHSINLGTDLKNTGVKIFLVPIFLIAFLIITALLLVRILKSFGAYQKQWTINLSVFFIFIILISGVFLVNESENKQAEKLIFEKKIYLEQQIIDYYSQELDNLSNTTEEITKKIVGVKNETYD